MAGLLSFHNHYYILKRWMDELELDEYLPQRVVSITIDKSKLIYLQLEHLCLRIYLVEDSVVDSNPKNQSPSRKALPIWKQLWGLSCHDIQLWRNDRVLDMRFENDYQLLVALTGKRGNAFLLHKGEMVTTFRKKLTIPPTPSPFSDQEFLEYNLRSLDNDTAAVAQLQRGEIKVLVTNQVPLGPPLLVPVGIELPALYAVKYQASNGSLVTALDEYLRAALSSAQLLGARQSIIDALNNQVLSLKFSIKTYQNQIRKAQTTVANRQLADNIMANMHLFQNVKQGESVDYYNLHEQAMSSMLWKANANPLKHAESIYKESKSFPISEEELKAKLDIATQQLDEALQQQQLLMQVANMQELKQFQKAEVPTAMDVKAQDLPFHVFQIQGYTVYAGKNAKNNDLLTTKFARKHDVWLHATDFSGSHVVVRCTDTKTLPPKPVIEQAAAIAAFLSKGKHTSVCAVSYTIRKYVVKNKAHAPGQVRLIKSKTLLVEPALPKS